MGKKSKGVNVERNTTTLGKEAFWVLKRAMPSADDKVIMSAGLLRLKDDPENVRREYVNRAADLFQEGSLMVTQAEFDRIDRHAKSLEALITGLLERKTVPSVIRQELATELERISKEHDAQK